MIFTPSESAAIQVAFEHDIFSHVPVDSTVTSAELSSSVQLDEDRLLRVMRLLVLNDIFAEVREKVFVHTPLSAIVVSSDAAVGSGFLFHSFAKSSARLAEAIGSADGQETAWKIGYGMPVYEYFEKHPRDRERFGKALATLSVPDMEDLIAMVPWHSFRTVVDVGGGAGHVAQSLAKTFPHLQLVNQDMPGVIEDCKSAIRERNLSPEDQEMYSRIQFEAHDYYQEQTRRNTDAFLLRQCLHNNTDANCIRILKAIVPGLSNPTARLLINETIMESWEATSKQKSKRLRRKDLMAMTIGAKERSRDEFLALLKAADERYEVRFGELDCSVTRLEN